MFTDYSDQFIQNRLYIAVKFAEILNILNFSLHFEYYCISGTFFWNQLKYSSKINVFIIDFVCLNN
jgi:hypothetical protein